MSRELDQVFRRCEETASWFEVKIENVQQKNSMGDTPLHTVCSWGEVGPVEVLIKAGADVNARGDRGCTPVFNAIIGESAQVVRALRRNGANFEIKSVDGRTASDYAKNIGASRAVIDALTGKA